MCAKHPAGDSVALGRLCSLVSARPTLVPRQAPPPGTHTSPPQLLGPGWSRWRDLARAGGQGSSWPRAKARNTSLPGRM